MSNIITVTAQEEGMRIDKWFKANYKGVPYTLFQKLIRKGAIKIDGKKAKTDMRLVEGQEIRLPTLEVNEKKEPIKSSATKEDADKFITQNILYQNKNMIAINKPPGIPVQGGSGVKMSIDDMLPYLAGKKDKLRLVHRIDKDTSGVLLIARNMNAATELTTAFRKREIEKTYWALVIGVPSPKEGTIIMPLSIQNFGMGEKTVPDDKGGKKAVTHYKVLETAGQTVSLVELAPESGRKHQIRAHMAEIGFPIVGDGKYGGKEAFIEGISKKMHLHAKSAFHPNIMGDKIDVEAELPRHIKESIEFLGLRQP